MFRLFNWIFSAENFFRFESLDVFFVRLNFVCTESFLLQRIRHTAAIIISVSTDDGYIVTRNQIHCCSFFCYFAAFVLIQSNRLRLFLPLLLLLILLSLLLLSLYNVCNKMESKKLAQASFVILELFEISQRSCDGGNQN